MSAAYLSMVESGRDSPPGGDFIKSLIAVLELSIPERETLVRSAQWSQRHFTLHARLPTDHIELVNVLVDRLPNLCLTDIRNIRAAVDAAGLRRTY